MAQRQQHDPGTRRGERKGDQSKRLPTGSDPSKERGAERDSGRSWVHDEPPPKQGDDPPLRQQDEPQHSGYSDRETPEATDRGARPGRRSERPRNER